MVTIRSNRVQLALFFVLVFVASWGIWIPIAFSGAAVNVTGTVALGAVIPSVVGIVLNMWLLDAPGRREFWSRAFSFARIPAGWYALIFLIFPICMAIAFKINDMMFGTNPSLTGMMSILTNPLKLLSFVAVMLVGGPLAEEFGWRGFALDRLLTRFGVLRSSMIIGFIWFTWHLPLFFVNGTTQYKWGIGTTSFFIFFVQVMFLSVLFACVYNKTRRSILSVILLHFMTNSTATIISQLQGALPDSLMAINVVVQAFAITLVVVGSLLPGLNRSTHVRT